MNQDIAILLHESTKWTVKAAVKLLHEFHSANLLVTWRGMVTTPVDIGAACNPSIKATNVTSIKFHSRANEKEYTGSLSMFVVDRILGAWKHTKVIKKSEPHLTQQLLPFGCGYIDGEQVMEYAKINGVIIPILESGRQGQMKLALTSETEPMTGSAAVESVYADGSILARVYPSAAAH